MMYAHIWSAYTAASRFRLRGTAIDMPSGAAATAAAVTGAGSLSRLRTIGTAMPAAMALHASTRSGRPRMARPEVRRPSLIPPTSSAIYCVRRPSRSPGALSGGGLRALNRAWHQHLRGRRLDSDHRQAALERPVRETVELGRVVVEAREIARILGPGRHEDVAGDRHELGDLARDQVPV